LSGAFGWLAWEEDAPVGFILVRDLGAECEILSLGVAPHRRRRGAGRALLSAAIAETRRRDLSSMVLEVAVDNDPANALYAALGFVPVGRRQRYYRRPDGRADALILRMALPAATASP
jgi:[ribosomal protein S18]-alanine N-acetyltransferase